MASTQRPLQNGKSDLRWRIGEPDRHRCQPFFPFNRKPLSLPFVAIRCCRSMTASMPSRPPSPSSPDLRCIAACNISRLPDVDGDRPKRKKFKKYPIGYVHIDIAEVRTEQGNYTFLSPSTAPREALIKSFSCNSGTSKTQIPCVNDKGKIRQADLIRASLEVRLCQGRHRSPAHQAQASLDQRPGRTHEPNPQRSNRQTLLLRDARPVPTTSRRLRQRLQLRQKTQNSQRTYALRIYLLTLDKRTTKIQTQSN
jgi:hypothetical protein